MQSTNVKHSVNLVDKMRNETTQNFPDFDKMSFRVKQASVEIVVSFPSGSHCVELRITSLTAFILYIWFLFKNEVCKFSLCPL